MLKIDFQLGKIEDIIGNMDINNVKLNDDIDGIILPGINISNYEKINITKKQLPFYNILRKIIKFPDGSPIDSVVNDLLTWTEFEDINIHFRSQPKLTMKWRNHDTSSKVNFMTVKDKKARTSKHQDGKCQLASEILLAAYNRSENIEREHIVYGIILKGNLVRFYKVTFSESYLQELRKSKYPT